MLEWLFGTENERKRDEYLKLYNKLEDLKAEHDKLIKEAESSFSSYKSSMPCVAEDAMPFNDFLPAQERLDAKFSDYIDKEMDYRSKLVSASNQAYDRYLYYKRKAIEEAKED
ncbi:chorismate synthase [Terribacillus sp. 7520-G]|uniref:chorismate synthase n=1 Tax=Terribacillus TaxID=459532 RepID=UPI000BA69A36|nr:chorismate synthase [Terribacillus sp. 7520-G]PAD39870.1 hypothetical protein CHH53_02265 [Terribacillus sp. 7520-G]